MTVEDDHRREFEIYSTRFINTHTQNPHAAGIQYHTPTRTKKKERKRKGRKKIKRLKD